MSSIAKRLTPHRERQRQFQIVSSLHRGEAAIAMIAAMWLAIVMLMAAVALDVFTRRLLIIMVTMFVPMGAILARILNDSSQTMRFAASVIMVRTASQHCV
ncbi:MAG: hypothetical protein AAF802_00330 [Planctomycetota bacterium]